MGRRKTGEERDLRRARRKALATQLQHQRRARAQALAREDKWGNPRVRINGHDVSLEVECLDGTRGVTTPPPQGTVGVEGTLPLEG